MQININTILNHYKFPILQLIIPQIIIKDNNKAILTLKRI